MLVQIKESNDRICDKCIRKARIIFPKGNGTSTLCAEHYMKRIYERDKSIKKEMKKYPFMEKMLTHERYKLFKKYQFFKVLKRKLNRT